MATLTFGSTANKRPYGVLTVTETSTSTANNTSTLSITLVLKRPSVIESTATKTATCTINGTTYNWSGTIGGSGDKTLISKTQTVPHNNDGTKTIAISASIVLNITWGSVGNLGTISGNSTMKLTDIPRYANVTQSLNAKTETTITMKWTADATVDYIWYSTNNGSSWTGINVADGTGGTYTISGLSANTAYNIKTRVRRKDSQLTKDSSALSVTTYAYPYCNSMPYFTIGDQLTLGFYNPLKRSITVNIIGQDGSQISNDTTTGTSITGYNGSVVVERLYASIPNAQSGTYSVKVTYGSQVSTKTGNTYVVNINDCAPIIDSVGYYDDLYATSNITGNNQHIVQGLSDVFCYTGELTARYSATISTIRVQINNTTNTLTKYEYNGRVWASKGIGTINSGTDVTALFIVTDSRGVSATKSLTITMLAYSNPTAIITLQRHNNYYSETDITIDGDYTQIGSNTIAIDYRYKEVDGSTWSDWVVASDNVTSTFTADNTKEWNVQVRVTDLFGGSTTYNLVLQIGMPIVYFDRVKHSVGVNCFPKDNNSVEVNGYNLLRNVMTRSLSAAMTNLAVNTYTIIPFDLTNSAGDKLTATSDGGIQIGANVSKILVSGMLSYDTIQSTSSRHIRIVKNSYTANNTLAWSWQTLVQGQPANVEALPILADVQEGDVIYMLYYTGNANDKIGGNAYGCRTSLTVETVM